MQLLISGLFALGLIIAYMRFTRWRLALLLVMLLGGPPYLDYELAWVGKIAEQLTTSLRPEITRPVFAAYDIILVLSLVLLLADRCRSLSRWLPGWVLFTLPFLVLVGISASVLAFINYPEFRMTALVGLANTIRVPLTVGVILLTTTKGFYSRETLCGLCAGTVMYALQGLYITWVKFGSLDFGSVPFSGSGGPGPTGSVLVLTVPSLLALSVFSGPASSFLKRLCLAVAIGGAVLALLTWSRGAALGLAVALGVLAVGGGLRHRRRVAAIVALMIFLAGCLWVFIAPDHYRTRALATFTEPLAERINLGRRYQYWDNAIRLMADHWQFGVGPAMWAMVLPGEGITAHQAYLQYAAENGVLGLVLLVSLLLQTLRVAGLTHWRERRNPSGFFGWRLGMMSGLVGYMASQMFSNSSSGARLTIMVWAVVGLLIYSSTSSAKVCGPDLDSNAPVSV